MPKINKENIERYQLNNIEQFILNTFKELTEKSIDDRGISEFELEKREKKKEQLEAALRNCGIGNIKAKQYVISYITDILTISYQLDETSIDRVINFNNPLKLSVSDKFHILLYKYKKKFQYNALYKLIKKYNLDQLREENDNIKYYITKEQIEEIYDIEEPTLNFEEKLDILSQMIYVKHKGLGCIDEIRDMRIDGISVGVSGMPEDFIEKTSEFSVESIYKLKEVPKSYDSVWVLFEGKEIHFRFLGFGSYEEIQRVCENIYRYKNPGEFSEADGFIVNEMADGSRIVVLRPPFCETWCFFVRKFDLGTTDPKELIKGENSGIVVDAIKFLMRGNRTVSFTGDQGAGKSTLLVGATRYIYGIYTLRVLEMFFETHLRKSYPDRNIVTMQETKTINGQMGLDISKKTNGAVSIVGEVAEDPVAAYLIQAGQVAYKFNLFTHHAKTFRDLVMALRNSLLKTGAFSNEKIAEEQVIRVLNFDIHLNMTLNGFRYIERITECVPIEEERYPTSFRKETNLEDKISAFMETALVFFKKMTGDKLYEESTIIQYNLEEERYEFVNPISKRQIKEMYSHMSQNDRAKFKEYLDYMNTEIYINKIRVKEGELV